MADHTGHSSAHYFPPGILLLKITETMNIYWFTVIFITWYILSLVISERIGKKRRIGEEWSFFVSIMLSPVIGLAITLLFKPGGENLPGSNGTNGA